MATAKKSGTSRKQPPTHHNEIDNHPADHKFCTGCGAKMHKQARACPKCGLPVHNPGEKSQVTAGLLALFLGGLGVHKFYLGQPWIGVLYILFCWTYIPVIIGLIEAIVYFTASPEKWHKISHSK